MKSGSILISLLLAAGCSGPADRPLIEGPLRFLEVKTSETSREGSGGFTVPVHARLYREYLLVTYNPARSTKHTEAIPCASYLEGRVRQPGRTANSNPYPQPPAKGRLPARKAVRNGIFRVRGASCYDSATLRTSLHAVSRQRDAELRKTGMHSMPYKTECVEDRRRKPRLVRISRWRHPDISAAHLQI